MRYRVNWVKDGRTHDLVTGDVSPGQALQFAWALMSETRPSDAWIETEAGRRVAGYDDIVEEGPLFTATRSLSEELHAYELGACV